MPDLGYLPLFRHYLCIILGAHCDKGDRFTRQHGDRSDNHSHRAEWNHISIANRSHGHDTPSCRGTLL